MIPERKKNWWLGIFILFECVQSVNRLWVQTAFFCFSSGRCSFFLVLSLSPGPLFFLPSYYHYTNPCSLLSPLVNETTFDRFLSAHTKGLIPFYFSVFRMIIDDDDDDGYGYNGYDGYDAGYVDLCHAGGHFILSFIFHFVLFLAHSL